jgi:ribosomal protein S18 acetylase RimI-like enzyme
MESLLDNPIWEALSSYHRHYNEGDDRLKYFYPAISPFVAMNEWDQSDQDYLEQNLPADRNFFYIIKKKFELPASCKKAFSIPLYQMVCRNHKPYTAPGITTRPLEQADIPQMIELTALTKPGPFNQRTIEFGNYIGIFDGDRLAAMAGERLKCPGYTEVSAICTHPDYTGKGYGAVLLSQACARIIRDGQIPFLHVRHDNTRAIKMYEQAGFEIRTEMDFAIFRKNDSTLTG